MKCKICNNESRKIFSAKILNKYNIDYFYCDNCGFLQTEKPYWLKEAYLEPIGITDTGCLGRNINLSKLISAILWLYFNKEGKYLDYAGGYGVFVRLMRDIGFDFYWYDKYTPNLFARGFVYNKSMKNDIEAITCFEAFEHFEEPIQEIEKMLSVSKNIIFTTELLPSPVPKPNGWWYYTLEDGQHISFYSEKTFQYIAKKVKLKYLHFRNIHILTEKGLTKQHLLLAFGLNKINIFDKFLKLGLKSKTWRDFLYTKTILKNEE